MASFSNLLRDIRWAWLCAVVAALITVAAGVFDYILESRVVIPNRVAFFEAFLYGPVFGEGAKKVDLFPQTVRTLLGEGPVSVQRFAALRALLDDKMNTKRELLLGLDLHTIMILVQHRENIPVLIQKEKEHSDKLRFNWLTGLHRRWVFGFHPAVLVWQIASVISLLVYWGKYSFAMNYFPYRTWWFGVFCILTFPWSSALGIVCVVSLVANGISKLIARSRRHNSIEPSYEQFCASLKQNLPSLRTQWEELFPVTLQREKTRELGGKVATLRKRLTELGSEMETTEREYAAGVVTLERLDSQSTHQAGRDEELWRKEWREELEQIIANPHVKGIQIVTSGKAWLLEIYTGTFGTLWGNLGPMKIVVDLESGGFIAGLAHKTAVLGSLGQNSPQRFCFGDAFSSIYALTEEHKIKDALGVMIASFEAGDAYV